MGYIDVTGKTEAEALEKALAQLGLSRDDVSVEILERAKNGFLGLGSSPAKIRVTYDDVQEEPAAQEASAPAAPVVPEKKAEAERREKKAAPRREKKPEQGDKPRQQAKSEPAPAAPADLGAEADDEKSRQIRTFLSGLIEHMDARAEVKVYLVEKDRYKVYLEGEHLGQLIGRRGETLDAMQQLTSYAVNRGNDRRVRVQLDAENYREKREQSLQRLAVKVAGKVVRYRKNVTLEPMNAYERHVIHTALQDYDHVTTYSMGTEPNRRVVVAYEK